MLNPQRAGAHDRRLLEHPSLARYAGWSPSSGVALVTLAPELPGGIDAVRALTAAGVVVSIGHTAATPVEVADAVTAGATSVTHLFNAMSPFSHRDPGVVGAALADTRLSCGLIVDGIHLDPITVAVAWRALGPARTLLVTDAVAALGMPFGEHPLGGTTVTVGPGGVRLADGTLAGSSLSAVDAVRNLVDFTGCEMHEAVGTITWNPARLLRQPDRGILEPGRRADLVVLTPELDVVATMVGGQLVYEQPGGVRWKS
jgi:N-acetylglucosamine-6-phosphate deacetylase